MFVYTSYKVHEANHEYLKHEVLYDAVELAPLVVERDAVRSVALVAFAKVQKVCACLGAHASVQLERNALRLLVSNLPGGRAGMIIGAKGGYSRKDQLPGTRNGGWGEIGVYET